MTTLHARLLELVRRDGPLGFDRFQELALYDQADGYYEKAGRVGRSGDFVTAPTWHPAFGRCLARLLERLPAPAGEGPELLDVGAGEGELLASAAASLPGALRPRLLGVERSAVRRRLAQARVASARWFASLDELPGPVTGLVVAYELIDALPVRALEIGKRGELLERRVAEGPGGRLVFEAGPCPDGAAIRARLSERGVVLAPGQRFEVRPGAVPVARALAGALREGILLVFDYGAPTRALYGPVRREGTLSAFRGHEVSRDVLDEPGERDLTAWVDFGEVEEALAGEGLEVHGLVSQSRLLLSLGIAGELTTEDPEAPASAERIAERRAVAALFAPGGMGESIRVLVASRGPGLPREEAAALTRPAAAGPARGRT